MTKKSDDQREANWVSKETLEEFKKKLGFIKRTSQNDDDPANLNIQKGRGFIQAP